MSCKNAHRGPGSKDQGRHGEVEDGPSSAAGAGAAADAAAATSAFAAAPPPPVAAAPAPPRARAGGHCSMPSSEATATPRPAAPPPRRENRCRVAAARGALQMPRLRRRTRTTKRRGSDARGLADARAGHKQARRRREYSHDPEDLKPTPPPPPVQHLDEAASWPRTRRLLSWNPYQYRRRAFMRGRSPPRPRRRDARRRSAGDNGRGELPPKERRAPPSNTRSTPRRVRISTTAPRRSDESSKKKGNKDPQSARSSPRSTPCPRRSRRRRRRWLPDTSALHGDPERLDRGSARASRRSSAARSNAHTPRMLTRGKPTKWSAKKRSRHTFFMRRRCNRDRRPPQRAREASQHLRIVPSRP